MFEYQLVADNYHLIKLVSKHSHDLVTPQCAHYLKSHRRIEFSQLGLIDNVNIILGNIMLPYFLSFIILFLV
ncbi:hypothetical protein RHMOL_Rhmol04G0180100 [Rhododendron molle]|uniref:Uncharacterized protein n=1 Tax=Rhododendron molle TaxID=49168 RepID=A0ACC0P3A1_RHOML|nr:hypothetical protein RHMOL_Rhmol04G0180100 [Rhododendron molle]